MLDLFTGHVKIVDLQRTFDQDSRASDPDMELRKPVSTNLPVRLILVLNPILEIRRYRRCRLYGVKLSRTSLALLTYLRLLLSLNTASMVFLKTGPHTFRAPICDVLKS
jgi:hypothetical protein